MRGRLDGVKLLEGALLLALALGTWCVKSCDGPDSKAKPKPRRRIHFPLPNELPGDPGPLPQLPFSPGNPTHD